MYGLFSFYVACSPLVACTCLPVQCLSEFLSHAVKPLASRADHTTIYCRD
jgi:hypothetical protein